MSNATAARTLPPINEALNRKRRKARAFHNDLKSFWFLLTILTIFVVLFLLPLAQPL